MPPANEDEAEGDDDEGGLPSPGSAEVAIELALRPAARDENVLELSMRVHCFGAGAAAREELLTLDKGMPSKDSDEKDEEEATRVLPPLRKHCDAIFECRRAAPR